MYYRNRQGFVLTTTRMLQNRTDFSDIATVRIGNHKWALIAVFFALSPDADQPHDPSHAAST
jgi:hypothetical protein